jgi:hypothetical protein
MSRWKKPDTEVTEHAIYIREWSKTEAGIAFKKKHAEYAKEWRKQNRGKFLATQKRANVAMRLEALVHYSQDPPACRCCGESEISFLQLDHKDGDGAAHRRAIGMAQGSPGQVEKQNQKVNIGGNGFVYWLKKNGWPPGFQVLCANCNYSKRVGKYCVHEIQRGVDIEGNRIEVIEKLTETVMPQRKGPERDAWLASPEGIAYRERQAAAKRGKTRKLRIGKG